MPRITDQQSYLAARERLDAASLAYYDADEQGAALLMSDADYDALMRDVAAYEEQHSIADGASSAVAAGAAVTGDVEHGTPMLSLDNVFDPKELVAFLFRAERLAGSDVHTHFDVDPKLDGLALAVRYQQGVPVQLVTRGDGRHGEDVTYTLASLSNLPRLSNGFTAEVRGEAIFSREQFEAANQLRIANSDKPFVNARNGAAGALRGSRSRSYVMPMSFVAYDIVDAQGYLGTATTFSDAMDVLELEGFTTARSILVAAGLDRAGSSMITACVPSTILAIEKLRDDLPFEIDGAVIKIDSYERRARAGIGTKSPNWAVAYKYPAQEVTSTLEEVIWQVGRTGVITPRARIAPVECGGVVIEYATLHNPGDMARRGFMLGDTVLVKRAGEVIPRLEGVLEARRDGTQRDVPVPTTCPRCDGPIDASQERWRCTKGRACGVAETLVYAVSRDALDVEGLGKVQVNNLVASGKVADLADLFDLTEQDLVDHGKLAPANAVKVFEGLDAALRAPFDRVMIALGLKSAGRSGGRALAREFKSMEAIKSATVDQLADMVVSVNRLGYNKAEDVRADLDDLIEAGVINRLDEAGMTMELSDTAAASNASDDQSPAAPVAQPLAGMAVCVTGTMTQRTRGQMEELVASLGGRAASSVSSKTDLLVAGPGAGSKLAKAQQLGIPVLDEDQFLSQYAN